MFSKAFIVAAMPFMVQAVRITSYGSFGTLPTNDKCDVTAEGAFVQCNNIGAGVCCGSYWDIATIDSWSIEGLNTSNAGGRRTDSADLWNGDDKSACATSCSGAGGFENTCLATYGGCASKPNSGASWTSGDVPAGRFAKRAPMETVEPDAVGIYDSEAKKHHRFNIGAGVPEDIKEKLKDAVLKNRQYQELDEAVLSFEIAE